MRRVFFTDRDLGKQFPALLRKAGILVEQHADHFEPNAPDDVWLAEVAQRGWVVLTHDQRIRYKVNERDAVMENGLAMLVMVGKAPFAELAASFVKSFSRVDSFLERNRPPLIAKVYRASPAELSQNPNAAGRVEFWLSAWEWRPSR